MSEIKYYDNGAATPDGVFRAAMEAASPYAQRSDRSHEADAEILTGVAVTAGFSAIAATNAEAAAQELTTAQLAASTARYVKVAIPAGADSQTLKTLMQTAGAKLGAAAAKVEATAIEAGAGIELTLNLSRADVFTGLVDLKTAMDERGCPAGRAITMPAALFGELAKDTRIQNETDIEVSGRCIRALGFEIFADEGLNGEMLAWASEALSVAQIVTAYERTAAQVSAQVNAGAAVRVADWVACVTVS